MSDRPEYEFVFDDMTIMELGDLRKAAIEQDVITVFGIIDKFYIGDIDIVEISNINILFGQFSFELNNFMDLIGVREQGNE